MDVSDYKDEFISEARDHLDMLNENLLGLEKEPEDEDYINKIFRSFHTLKGNAALMGYKKFSELAHSLEDLLSLIRDKKLIVKQNIMDVLLEGCDLLEGGLSSIETGDEQLEPESLISEVKSLINVDSSESVVQKLEEHASLTDEQKNIIKNYESSGKKVFRLVVNFDPKNPLKSAKALVMFRDLEKNNIIITSNPPRKEVDKGNLQNDLEIILASDVEKVDLEKKVSKISGIKHVQAMHWEDSFIKPKHVVNGEKEHSKQQIVNKHHTDTIQQIQSVKVPMKKLDKLMNLVGELLINNIQLQEVNKKKSYDSLLSLSVGIDRLIMELQDQVMSVRMVPIKNIFNRFPRMVRDLAEKENKQVELVVKGADMEFDRTVLDQIGEPLVHLLRNSVDHGIESPDERLKSGKTPVGVVSLIVVREKNHAIIKIMDDGAGIDSVAVKESSIKKGLITPEEASILGDNDALMLIFKPGVSTSQVITDVSGRGVGMDVVYNKIKELGGVVQLNSELGKGTTVTIRLPLSVAIISALLIDVGGYNYALPLTLVDQIIDLDSSRIKSIQGHKVFIHRGKNVPIFWLHELLGHGEKTQDPTVIIVNKGGQQIGLAVDSILAQQQVLVKELNDVVKGTKGYSGATILGDGSVVLILDVDTLL